MTSSTNFRPGSHSVDGLYVHVPFCDGKCGYCAFYSVLYAPELADAYLDALDGELDRRRDLLPPLAPATVYVGGGTPTMLTPAQLARLSGLIRGLDTTGLTEWTVEANPGSLDAAKLRVLAEAGVNRISLGAQSFDDRILAALGRRHSAADVEAAAARVLAAGIENWGLDLMVCVPGEEARGWEATLQRAVRLGPAHVSVYALTVEEGTRLARDARAGTFAELDDAAQLERLDIAEGVLTPAGYRRYEISNYARPGRECRHNLACWRGGEYLGLGCAAASHVGTRRWTNHGELEGYLAAHRAGRLPPGEEEMLTPATEATDRLIFGLRMADGVDTAAVLQATGLVGSDVAARWAAALAELEREGLVTPAGSVWRLTRRGLALADHVAVALLP